MTAGLGNERVRHARRQLIEAEHLVQRRVGEVQAHDQHRLAGSIAARTDTDLGR